jgi:hypothetical protein
VWLLICRRALITSQCNCPPPVWPSYEIVWYCVHGHIWGKTWVQRTSHTRHFDKVCGSHLGFWFGDLLFNSDVHLEGNPYTKFEHSRTHIFLGPPTSPHIYTTEKNPTNNLLLYLILQGWSYPLHSNPFLFTIWLRCFPSLDISFLIENHWKETFG